VKVPDIGVAAGTPRTMSPTLLQGCPPRSAEEIVLGTSTLQQVGKRVGEWGTASSGGHPRRFHIVGRAVFPNFGQGSFTPTDLGQGAETTAAALAVQVRAADVGRGFEFVLVRFDRGVNGRWRPPGSGGCCVPSAPACSSPPAGDWPAAEQHHRLRAHRHGSRGPRRPAGRARARGPIAAHRGLWPRNVLRVE